MNSQAHTRNASVATTPFGDVLRRFRLRAGLTQEELAERAGLSTDAISALERGARRRAQPRTVRALAAALGLSDADQMGLSASGSQRFPPDSRVTVRHALPVPPTPLVGREHEQAAVLSMLDQPEVRLLTMIGPGGVGKTRLGLAVAADASDRFDGASFVDLATLDDPAFVLSFIARSLGLREHGGRDPLENLAAHIADRALLLMLDNFEHLAAAAPVIPELLARCPRLKVLATSRALLRVRGEHVFAVSPLAVPDESVSDAPTSPVGDLLEYPAVRLFIDRAQAADPGFALTSTNAHTIAEICRRLDGLPLAIELAAARTLVLSPLELLTRLTNRLALLTEGPVDVPARQRTLRAAMDWSYDLLDAAEKDLLRRLAVFVGGFTLDAAEQIGGRGTPSVLDGIESLAGKSLLRRTDTADEDTPRFDLLETVREYGLERLKDSDQEQATRTAHANYFLALVEQAELELIGPAQRQWLDRLETEHANLRSALAWLTRQGDLGSALSLAAAISWFWWYRGHYAEGRARLEHLLDHPKAVAQGRPWAAAMSGLGLLTRAQGDSARAVRLHEAAVAAWRHLADQHRLADALFLQGLALMYAGDEQAIAVLSESLAISRTLPDPKWLGGALWALGRALHRQGDLASAAVALEESLARARQLENPSGIAVSLLGLGGVAWDQGNEARALAHLRQAMALLRDLGDAWSSIQCLEWLAATEARNDPRLAARLLAAAAAWRDALELPRPPEEEERHERVVALVRGALGDTEYAAVSASGRTLTPEQAIAEALAAPLGERSSSERGSPHAWR